MPSSLPPRVSAILGALCGKTSSLVKVLAAANGRAACGRFLSATLPNNRSRPGSGRSREGFVNLAFE